MDHYFSSKATTENIKKTFEYTIMNEKISFTTSNSVFSKNQIDFGTDLMLITLLEELKDFSGKILDVGCGYGPIGLTMAKFFTKATITMIDVNERAVELARENAIANGVSDRVTILISDRFENIQTNFDLIITNPPIRAGKDIVHSIYEGGCEHLNPNGSFYSVIQKKQGAPSSIAKLTSLFGNCVVQNKKAGYFILKSTKN